MILTVLVICAILTVGILIGIEINQYFGNDNYWKGYDDGFADGYDERMEEYDTRESSKPTPSEFLEQFEEFLNSEDNEELDKYDKGWLDSEKYIKENYTLIPKFDAVTTDAVNAVEDLKKEVEDMENVI